MLTADTSYHDALANSELLWALALNYGDVTVAIGVAGYGGSGGIAAGAVDGRGVAGRIV